MPCVAAIGLVGSRRHEPLGVSRLDADRGEARNRPANRRATRERAGFDTAKLDVLPAVRDSLYQRRRFSESLAFPNNGAICFDDADRHSLQRQVQSDKKCHARLSLLGRINPSSGVAGGRDRITPARTWQCRSPLTPYLGMPALEQDPIALHEHTAVHGARFAVFIKIGRHSL
jgi:hypothetical protein